MKLDLNFVKLWGKYGGCILLKLTVFIFYFNAATLPSTVSSFWLFFIVYISKTLYHSFKTRLIWVFFIPLLVSILFSLSFWAYFRMFWQKWKQLYLSSWYPFEGQNIEIASIRSLNWNWFDDSSNITIFSVTLSSDLFPDLSSSIIVWLFPILKTILLEL